MKTPLAIYNLWHQGAKTIVSIGGVAFALLLVFMQLGFMGAVSYTATNVFKKLDFDIVIRAQDYLHLYEASTIDRDWLAVAESTPGVKSARPFWGMIHNWRKLPNRDEIAVLEGRDDNGPEFKPQYLPIAIMAYRPEDCLLTLEDVQSQSHLLHRGAFLLDDSTKSDYGPWNGRTFDQVEDVVRSQDDRQRRRRPEIGGTEYVIAGLFELGTGLAANGAAIMSDQAFSRISPWNVQEQISLGLVSLDDNSPASVSSAVEQLRLRVGTDPEEVRRLQMSDSWSQVRAFFGGIAGTQKSGEVEILSKVEAEQREKFRWLWQTPIGLIFQMGVVISLLVGAAIVYMVLSTDVANRLPEYATLLAMGYSRKFLASIVMTQAITLCLFGFVSAWAIAEVLYRVTTWFSGIPLIMNPFVVVLVGVLGLLMCVVSGLLAMRKLWKAEPASLF